MAASLDIGNGWQSPRISFTFDFSQTETGRNTNDLQSPRISFSLNLSQTDRIPQEKYKREDVSDINYDTDFEFCFNGRNSITAETHLAIADELFLDGKMLPLFQGHVKAQPVPIASHISLENLKCLSPVRFYSSPAKITSSCCGTVASKSLGHKPPNRWKEMLLKLIRNKENVCADNRRTSFELVDQSQHSNSTKSVWSFSRSCRTVGGEVKGNGFFRSLPFSRSHSTAERKCEAANSGCSSKELETDLSGLVEGSKPPEAWRISNKVQPQSQPQPLLKPRPDAEEGKEKTKAKQYTAGRGKLGSCRLPESRMRRGMSGQWSTGRVGGNGRFMQVRNMDSPPPGKPMAEGSLLVKANNSMGGGIRVSPVLNVGGRWNGGGGLFDFFSKREKKQSAYHHCHHSHGFTNRKKGT